MISHTVSEISQQQLTSHTSHHGNVSRIASHEMGRLPLINTAPRISRGLARLPQSHHQPNVVCSRPRTTHMAVGPQKCAHASAPGAFSERRTRWCGGLPRAVKYRVAPEHQRQLLGNVQHAPAATCAGVAMATRWRGCAAATGGLEGRVQLKGLLLLLLLGGGGARGRAHDAAVGVALGRGGQAVVLLRA